MKVVFGLEGMAYPVQMLGDRKAVCCFCVYQHGFLCLLTEQTQSNSPSSALMTPEKWQHYHTGTHTLPSHLHPWGQKPNVERQKGGMITLNGGKQGFGGVGKTRGGD